MTRIDGHTRIFGILGHPTGHSLSPLIHNAAFASRKLNAVYVPFDVERSTAALHRGIAALGIAGLSVTIPHKAWAAKIADHADPLSQYCGAANTLIRDSESGELSAYNTDGPGAVRALKTGVPGLRGRRFLLLGYGGSATAIAHALLHDERPAMLAVAGRSKRKIQAFTQQLKSVHGKSSTQIRAIDPAPADDSGYKDLAPEDIDIIIHTTPLGMSGYAGSENQLPLPKSFIQADHTVFDIVYNPMRTPLMKHAAAVGAKTIPGYLMLLYQATLQFSLFTGQDAPENLMEKELLSALRRRSRQS